jgi:hypothetical protein
LWQIGRSGKGYQGPIRPAFGPEKALAGDDAWKSAGFGNGKRGIADIKNFGMAPAGGSGV